MRSCLCRDWGLPSSLIIEDGLSIPTPGRGQVAIAVFACGINFPDLLMVQGKYQVRPPLPFAPGGEVAGIISGLGEGTSRFSLGDRVVAFTGYGGCSTNLVVAEGKVSPLPEGMDFQTGSSFFVAYGTADYALRVRAGVSPSDLVLVLGASGGVGLAAIQLAKAAGATVIAAASSPEKLHECQQSGADVLLDYGRGGKGRVSPGSGKGAGTGGSGGGQDLSRELKRLAQALGKRGVDVVLDSVGGSYSEPAMRSMAVGGRYLVVGFASGKIPQMPLNLMLLKEISVVGIFWGAWFERDPDGGAEQCSRLVRMYMEGLLQPVITRVYPLEETPLALKHMGERKVVGKVVIATRESGLLGAEAGGGMQCNTVGESGKGEVVRTPPCSRL